MRIIISGKNIKLTGPIEDYTNKKIEGLEKFFSGIIRADVNLGMETRHHQKGKIFFIECKLEVPGFDVFAKKNASSLYEAIDLLREYLELELKKHKAKLRAGEKKTRTARRNNKEYQEE